MNFLLKKFGKKNAAGARPVLTPNSSPSSTSGPSTFELVYEDAAVGIRCIGSGETHWLPWCVFQNVQVLMREPFVQGQYVYDIMAEFDSADIGWEVAGFNGFIEAMGANLDGFDLEAAARKISKLGRDNPMETIYISPNYEKDIATR